MKRLLQAAVLGRPPIGVMIFCAPSPALVPGSSRDAGTIETAAVEV